MDEHKTLAELFFKQLDNQQHLLSSGAYAGFTGLANDAALPVDDPRLCSYHVQQLISEVGEVLDADKRWKNFRNDKNDSAGKLEEIADCLIVVMNLAIFSGFDAYQVERAVAEKLQIVSERIQDNR